MIDAKAIKKIDAGILPLINAMNSTGWMETISCCEGYPGAKFFHNPYIAFFCKTEKIDTLSKILNKAINSFKQYETPYLDLGIAFYDDVNGCQADAPKGYISLSLDIGIEPELKLILFKRLTTRFVKEAAAQAAKVNT